MKLIEIKGELYEIIRLIPEHTEIDTEKFRISTNSTNVFRKDGMFWFVRIAQWTGCIRIWLHPIALQSVRKIWR